MPKRIVGVGIDDVVLFDSTMRRILAGKLKLLVCERGFLDQGEGVPVSDALALGLVIERHNPDIKAKEIVSALEACFWGVKFPVDYLKTAGRISRPPRRSKCKSGVLD